MHFATGSRVEAVRGPSEYARERLLVGSELVPQSIGEVGAAAAEVAAAAMLIRADFYFDQFPRVRHWQGAQAHRVEQVEDSGVSPNAEREAQNRDAEEARFEPDQTKGVAQVLSERFQKADGVHTVGNLLGGGDIAEFAVRCPGGLLWMHAAGDVVVDFVQEMGLDFEGEVPIALRTPEVS
jgi:hypothetical protein